MMKLGRFVVDTHVHGQRFAAGRRVAESGAPGEKRNEWDRLSKAMPDLVPYDNSARLIYDMDCYGVDRCVLLPAFGMTNELNAEIVQRHPERFVAVCNAHGYVRGLADSGEEWSIEGVCDELERLLATGAFVGIGEGIPAVPYPLDPKRLVSREEHIGNLLAIAEVARRHDVSLRYHTGSGMGYDVRYSTGPLGPGNFNPMWAHDVASAFPDVTLILDHGGIQGWWSERLWEDCLHVAAAHDNVFLETGLWWSELYEKPLLDPNIGPEKLIWGTDWGASIPFHSQPGRYPEAYAVQLRGKRPVRHQVDVWGWSLRELARLRIPQDDLNLILGGNAARIFKLELPHTRLFRERD